MEFKPEFSIDGIIQIVGFTFAIIGLSMTYIQMKRTAKTNRIKFISDLTNDLLNDNDIRDFFYKLDYEKFKFKVGDFKSSKEERWLDSILFKYDVIGKMVLNKALTIPEIEFVLFEIIQVYKNKEVQKYLKWLDKEYVKHGMLGLNKRKRAHDDFRSLAELISKTQS